MKAKGGRGKRKKDAPKASGFDWGWGGEKESHTPSPGRKRHSAFGKNLADRARKVEGLGGVFLKERKASLAQAREERRVKAVLMGGKAGSCELEKSVCR